MFRKAVVTWLFDIGSIRLFRDLMANWAPLESQGITKVLESNIFMVNFLLLKFIHPSMIPHRLSRQGDVDQPWRTLESMEPACVVRKAGTHTHTGVASPSGGTLVVSRTNSSLTGTHQQDSLAHLCASLLDAAKGWTWTTVPTQSLLVTRWIWIRTPRASLLSPADGLHSAANNIHIFIYIY